MSIALTGIKPTGTLHLGNYVGAIRPALEQFSRAEQSFCFIADYHALNALYDPAALRHNTYAITAALLALGLDPETTCLYRQSQVPEVFELATLLLAITPNGVLNRAHAYKAAVAANLEQGKSDDDGVNLGLFTYPVLMAADILLMQADVVPVGHDQVQHTEIARDLAIRFNSTFAPVFTLPSAAIHDEIGVRGLDGRKMSKSYHNTVELFAGPTALRKTVARIKTDSRRPEDPKDPDSCLVFDLYRHLATPEETSSLRQRYLEGGLGYATAKAELVDVLERTFAPARDTYAALMDDPAAIDRILAAGAARARDRAAPLMQRVRHVIGIAP